MSVAEPFELVRCALDSPAVGDRTTPSLDIVSPSRATIIRYFSSIAGGFVLLLLVTAPLRDESIVVVVSYLGLLLAFASALKLRHKSPGVAGAICSIGPLVFVTVLSGIRGGVASPPALTAYLTLVVLTGLCWSSRGTFLAAILSSAIIGYFVMVGPETKGMSRFQVWAEIAFQLVTVAIIAHVTVRSLSLAAKEALAHQKAREALEARIQRSQSIEALGRLAGGVAHDFNNLLTIILSTTDLLSARGNLGEEVKADIDRIEEAATKASSLTAQLLAVGRKQVLKPKVLSPKETLDRLVPLLRRLLPANIELAVHSASDAGNINVDEARLEQVLINLVTNATDSMPDGGHLKLSAQNATLTEKDRQEHPNVEPGEYVELAVCDNGGGMSEDIKNRMFEPFFTTKPREKGTGLGLAMVHGIVSQSQGHIFVESRLGTGTCFRIYFKRSRLKPSEAEQKSEIKPLRCPARILLVEDATEVRHATKRLLEQLGHSVEEACNGQDALERYASNVHNFDLLVTDLMMPKMGGRPLSERLRKLHPPLKVLFISGYADDSFETPNELGTEQHYLAKPFTKRALQEKLRDLLEPQLHSEPPPTSYPQKRPPPWG